MTDFWSRRRAAVAAKETMDIEARELASLRLVQEGMTESELLASLELPDPDDMTAGDDFSAFLRREVPEFLRRRALRTLWRSSPVLANLDGLVDHGEDFSDTATVVPGMRTAYQVGRGMLDHVTARARHDTDKLADDGAIEQVADSGQPSGSFERSRVSRIRQSAAPGTLSPPASPVASTEPAAPMPRHMQFRFHEDGA